MNFHTCSFKAVSAVFIRCSQFFIAFSVCVSCEEAWADDVGGLSPDAEGPGAREDAAFFLIGDKAGELSLATTEFLNGNGVEVIEICSDVFENEDDFEDGVDFEDVDDFEDADAFEHEDDFEDSGKLFFNRVRYWKKWNCVLNI